MLGKFQQNNAFRILRRRDGTTKAQVLSALRRREKILPAGYGIDYLGRVSPNAPQKTTLYLVCY